MPSRKTIEKEMDMKIFKKRSFLEKAFGINKPKVKLSRNGKLLIDEYGNVRSNYDNPEVRAKLESQISVQAKMPSLSPLYEDS